MPAEIEYSAFGVTTSLRRWATLLSYPVSTFCQKYNKGWRPEDMLVSYREMSEECRLKHPKIKFPNKQKYCRRCRKVYKTRRGLWQKKGVRT